MFFIAFHVFVLCFIAGGVQCTFLMETGSTNNTHIWDCGANETECHFGCCPVEDGVCCPDGFHCCKQGQACIPALGWCIGAQNNNGDVSLESEKSIDLRRPVQSCPPLQTECGTAPYTWCCHYTLAVCCTDAKGKSVGCCPYGYTCDVPNKQCIPNRDASGSEQPLLMNTKSHYKSCPGGRQKCPDYMNCCEKENGDWDCCPNPSLPQIQYGAGQCCDTIFGDNVCCPNDYPVCSIFGCTK